MNRIFATLLILLLAACQPASAPTPPLQGARMGGAFSLIDQAGARRADTDFTGKYRIVYFGYTFCPDVCPVDVQQLMAGFKLFEKAAPERAVKVQPLFISIDPERDTPNALSQFVSAFHPRLIGLTGTPAEIADVAKRYAVFFQKGEQREKGAYLVDHSRMAVLYGPKGEAIAMLPHDGKPEAIAAELEKWVR